MIALLITGAVLAKPDCMSLVRQNTLLVKENETLRLELEAQKGLIQGLIRQNLQLKAKFLKAAKDYEFN